MANKPLDLLDTLGPRARAAFERLTERMTLPAGHTLFRQGAAPEAMYLVIAGSLGVYAFDPSHERQLIAVIEAGETVGEMAVLSGTPRSATVIAIRDCELLMLTKARFDLLQKHEPELMTGINRILVHRLRQVSRGKGMQLEPKTAALLPVVPGIETRPFAEKLARLLESEGDRVFIVESDDQDKPGVWFHEKEIEHDRVLFCGDFTSEEWVRKCVRQADRIMILARASGHAVTQLPPDLLQQRADHQLVDLILLHESGDTLPKGTRKWRDLMPLNRHFHIREGNQKDWDRLARVVSGRALGVVLSGGGARAYAHIGALKAITESGLDIDFIGGASMGAIIAAGLAIGWTIDEMSDNVHDAFVTSNPLSDLTIPLVSLVTGKNVERLMKDYFGNTEIGDLWLPYYCVSSNLSNGNLHVHREGRLRNALRASIALPGVLPPVIEEGHVLVDGAVMNNLPVDVMRSLHRGPIIAVDVTRDWALRPEMLAITQRGSFLQRLMHPPILSILMRAGTVSSDAEIERQAEHADLVVEPPLGDIDIRDWRAFEQTVTIGYEHTAELLSHSIHALHRLRRPTIM